MHAFVSPVYTPFTSANSSSGLKRSINCPILNKSSNPNNKIFFITSNFGRTKELSLGLRTFNNTLSMTIVASTAVKVEPSESIKLKSYRFGELSPSDLKKASARPRIDFSSIFEIVKPIIEDVRTKGDSAVKHYTEKFDHVNIENLVIKFDDIGEIQLDEKVKEAFDVAYENIYNFHIAQKDIKPIIVETMPGVECRKLSLPIESVGLYVPGGTAVLPSTALMLTVPAKIAGCDKIVIATPPKKDGSICSEVLYCAKKAGATHLLLAGGAQAVAAMAWGTESCPKVDKIFGPGNQYVTAAKMLLQNSEAMISIDMPAGPSEVLVIIDKYANPCHVASDLLSQAEHGVDSQVVLVAIGDINFEAIEKELSEQLNDLPRSQIASKAIQNSFVIFVNSIEDACHFSNIYAPEHLIINTQNAESLLPLIKHAGSVFLGPWTPESVGDYASGTNHVLPTYGYAKMYSGVGVNTFMKHMTVQTLSPFGLKELGPHVELMAKIEGLDAHARAVTFRLRDLPKST